ncbi:MAG: TetR/AcrR family transcriptional regulator, partial [Planctomycetaceae bacterium]
MADRRTEILEATCRVIGQSGVHELRVEDVAKEVGISPALVYYYFDTRADLLSRAFEYADARSMTNTLGKLDMEAPAAKQVHDILVYEMDDTPAVRDNWV